MKKTLFFAGIFLFSTVCAAPPLGSEEFTKWSNFEGIYGKIYNDLFVVDGTAVCERVLEWPEFWNEEGELIFSLEDCEEFADTGKLSKFVNTHILSKTRIDEWISFFRAKYYFEKQLWRYEYDLQRKLALSSLWNDGDGGGGLTPKKRTSPVDLVVRWNEIDNILFGIMAEYPEFASFTASEDDIVVPWAETPKEDVWLDQRAEKKITYGYSQDAYPEGELSLAGGYEEKAEMFEKDINPNSLIPGRATTQTFDMPFTGAPIPTSTGMHVDTDATPAESPDEPEQITILEQTPMGELEGTFAKFFRQQSASELRDAQEDGLRSNWFSVIDTTATKGAQAFADNIESLLQLRSETRTKDSGQLDLLPLQQFNIVLDAWNSILLKWQSVNDLFLTNPKL